MSTFNSLLIIFLALVLTACGSTPGPELDPENQQGSTSEPVSPSAADAPDGDDSEAVDSDPTIAETTQVDPAQLAYAAAVEELKEGSAEVALTELKRLGETVPGQPRLFTNIGLAHYRLEQFDEAELAFREAILRDDEDAVAHNHIGILQRRKGQFQEALQAYQRAIEIDVKYARAHLNLGILFDLYLQDLEKALEQYRRYQTLTNEQDKQVAGWIVDIERRLKKDS